MICPRTKKTGIHSVRLLKISLCLLNFIMIAGQMQASEPKADRPNLILIVSDDQGFDLGCFGKKEFITPNLDRMAEEGLRATNFYVTASVCTPSRSGLLTGRYPQRNGTYEMIRNDMVNYGHRYTPTEYAVSPEMTLGLDPREKTLGDLLRPAGYRTAVIGKWDMGQARRFLPLQRGFDDFLGHGNNGIDYYTHERYGMPSLFEGNRRTEQYRGRYVTEIFRDAAIRFIRENRERPFFLYLPFNAPHSASNLEKDSMQVPPEYLKKYYPDADPSKPSTRYAGMITAMDEAIGRIFETLKQMDLDRNTLVIFFADNGRTGASVNGDKLRGGKGSGFEGGLRVPMIARWPGRIPAGQTTDSILSSLEILPTFASVTGARLPEGVKLDGYDMLEVLEGRGESLRSEIFWDWPSSYQAARVGRYKWVSATPRDRRGLEPSKEFLFDLDTDPQERNDLSATHPEKLAEVKARFKLWETEMQMAEPRGPFRDY